MKIYLSILVGFLTVFPLFLNAQEESFRCATPEMNRKVLENDPQARQRRAELAEFVQQYIQNQPKDEQIYIIPVVFHVVHNYGSENISYDQIADGVRIMTEDFRLQNPDTSQIIDEFKQIAGDAKIEFRLAKIDPWGNCTNGVTRTQSYETSNGGEQIKDIAPSWPRSQYLNIWVVKSIPGGVAGYSYYPGTVGDGQDGILITHSYVGSIGTGSVGRSRTLTHETGHYLNLAHPWGSTNDPEVASNCEIDDGIEDTPNTIGNTSCNLYHESCGSLDNVQNHMDYAYCSRMFTNGQGEVMRAVLNSGVSDRDQLWQESNLIATGVLNPETAEICPPIADFSFDVSAGCEGFMVNYTDLTYQTDSISSYAWSFEGGTPSVSSERNPSVNYETEGLYDVSLTVVNPADNSSMSVTQAVRVYDETSGFDIPFLGNLENDFPQTSDFIASDYYFLNHGEDAWQYVDDASVSGDHAMMFDGRYEPYNIASAFVTPAVLVDSTDFPLQVDFKMAYSQRENNDADVLKVYVSKNCGETWILQYYKSGNALHTASNYHSFSTFIPDTDEWRSKSFEITESLFKYAKNLRLKFDFIPQGGNRIYIDDIELKQSPSAIENRMDKAQFELYPVPANDQLFLRSAYKGQADLELYDVTGKLLYRQTEQLETLTDLSKILSNDTQGLMILKIITSEGIVIKRFVCE